MARATERETGDAAEAQHVLDSLNNLINHAGEAYVELCGANAAMQAVVTDLRRCSSTLQVRLEGPAPSPPWLRQGPQRVDAAAGVSEAGPAGPPQLPLALRRAMQRYRETLQTREQLLAQHNERYQKRGDGGGGCTSLSEAVEASASSFCSALRRQYPDAPRPQPHGSGGGGRGGGGGPPGAAAQLQRLSLGPGSRQETHGSALHQLAAHRRKAQSASELAQTRAGGGGTAAAARRSALAEAVVTLAADVEALRGELQDTLQRLAEAQAVSRPGTGSEAAAGRHGGRSVGPPSGAVAEAAAAEADAALGIDDELAEAAALWRNRFLRAALNAAAPASRNAAPGAPAAGCVAAGLHVGARGRRAATRGPHGAGPAAVLDRRGRPPWHILLPPHAAEPWRQQPLLRHGELTAGTLVRTVGAAAPPPLLCGSAHDAVAHGRAQLQLQATAFQSALESVLAAPLVPRQRPPPPPPQPAGLHAAALHARSGSARLTAERAASEAAATAAVWERWLAQCRLAHLLLVKGSWNRLCSVAELEEEPGAAPGGELID
ncbi:hypothetical protein GPECTOR_74g678 [Gonium pectorale]|uniref:Uncharacterized protein n=1 Tax=Gonium pectorale TaxID=33097 RepID=A0A150G2M2_GONPE|nr:hypothetical protein GPECTOR_74g678 [Gonium pectorale]|eukprot:KXZ44064.1 hypothetical protein GPECTOR_74g678 [Gonium pectorale]